MKVLLDGVLPRVAPGLDFLCVPHEGKRDLELSLPRKLRAWREPGVRFAVVLDNDGGDCQAIKQRIQNACRANGRADTLVRIVCQELEAWYLGEPPEVLADVLGLARRAHKAHRDPDALPKPSGELRRLLPQFQKTAAARVMGKVLTPDRNRSHSFRAFVDGVLRLAPTRPLGE